ncbi:hypothetical protein [Streptomyces sp. KL118A]|uniref:hypothetical protein n=1 Tax=Streptomyces sp. KL118A TaxID=3045153 RepID=UPI00278BE38F|nr:hypothetical protein [Streptomyces sp. KL118A]
MRQSQWTRAARHSLCRVASAAALVSLVTTLFMCLGPVAPDGGHEGTGHTAAVAMALASDDCATPVEGSDCPAEEECCAPSAHGVRAVPGPAGPSLSALHHQVPYPQALSAPGTAVEQPSTRGSPDLHMLQVQRT